MNGNQESLNFLNIVVCIVVASTVALSVSLSVWRPSVCMSICLFHLFSDLNTSCGAYLGSGLEKEIMQETMPGARKRGNPTNGLAGQHQYVDRTIRGRVSQNDRDKWRKYVHGVANPRIEDG